MNVPTRAACGACHDDIVWASGTNHPGGIQVNDQQCSVCHTANGIQLAHVPVVPPDPNNKWNGGTNGYTNASYVAGNQNNLPPGANKVAWDLQSVTLTAAGNPQYVFRILIAGNAVSFQDPQTNTEMLPNYVGSPSLLIACALPQDGIAAPVDYNFQKTVYLKNLWNGTGGGTLTGPDANGYYTATLTGITIPTTASMITGGMGYTYGYYSQPLTQTNVPPTVVNGVTYADYTYNATTKQGGLSVPAPNVHMLATNLPAGYATQTARRAIINPNACNNCHKAMGVFEDAAFHAGERNDPTTCAFCHNSNGVNNGWPYNLKDMIHMMHGAAMRTNLDTWNNTDYFGTTYPAVLNNCEACHVPGSYDFSGSANAAAAQNQNLLWTTVASGTPSGIVLTDPTAYDPAQTYTSPFVVSGTNYGAGFAATTAGVTTEAAGTTLVNSPIASACYACHDSAIAKDHMTQNGGALDVPRSSVDNYTGYKGTGTFATPIQNNEACLVCHGAGRVADIKAVHMNF
jgi:OmcA/MtrC family decaheme c-type cytochrome